MLLRLRKQKTEVTVILGDLNISQLEMTKALHSADSFLAFSPYRTTVSPELYSKTIDHIFLDLGINSIAIRANAPNEILEEMQDLVDLLERFGDTIPLVIQNLEI